MRRFIILVASLAIGPLAAHAQAFIDDANAGTSVFITIQDPSITAAPVKIGTPAIQAGYQGAGPAQVTFSLYAALNGTALAVLESSANLIAKATNSMSTLPMSQGTLQLPGNIQLPSKPGFDGSQPLEFIFYGITSAGLDGWSAEATGVTPATGTGNGPFIFGTAPNLINSFLIGIPEPSTFAIAGVGTVALTLFRRRKV